MVSLTIDGTEITVAEGTNLVEAAAAAGVEVPTYCYHPGLTVVGQCRICFVEVEGMPRLVTACSTPVQVAFDERRDFVPYRTWDWAGDRKSVV